jgi:hypothetical protein
MAKYGTLDELHTQKRTRRYVITLADVLKRAYQIGWLARSANLEPGHRYYSDALPTAPQPQEGSK